MILRILGASLLALGIGFVVEGAHADATRLCPDGRIVRSELAAADPCERIVAARPAGEPALSPPLPVKRPAPPAPKVTLKGPTRAAPAARDIAQMAAATDYRRVLIINAGPGAPRWYDHTR